MTDDNGVSASITPVTLTPSAERERRDEQWRRYSAIHALHAPQPLPVADHDDSLWAKATMAVCPVCSDYYVHPEISLLERSGKGEEAEGQNPLGVRGDWLTIPMWCENCPARWRMAIGFSKGQTYIGAIDVHVGYRGHEGNS